MQHKTAFSLVTILLLLCSGTLPVRAQAQDMTTHVSYTFGEKIEFSAQLKNDASVTSVELFLQPQGEGQTRSRQAKWDGNRRLAYTEDLTQSPVRAFSNVVYWFEVTLSSGKTIKSEKDTFYYEDNRFAWRVRTAPGFEVRWYKGDAEFAQSILDVAGLGLTNIQRILPLKLNGTIKIYAYATAQEMRATLQTLGKNWTGAHADPDLSVMVVSLPQGPEQHLEIERQVPHELMHLLLYQWLGSGYGSLPVWYNEGLASTAELYPNPDYLVLLESAQGKDELLPIASLCHEFPRDASGAFLAYAEATSFTRYLYQQYGSSSLSALAKGYAEGMACERGVEVALGETLPQVERNWRNAAFGEAATLKALANLSPWLALLALAFLPIILLIAGPKRRSSPPTRKEVKVIDVK
jgi:hypothetical protein